MKGFRSAAARPSACAAGRAASQPPGRRPSRRRVSGHGSDETQPPASAASLRARRLVLAFFNDWWVKTGKAFNKSKLKWFPNTTDGTQMQNAMLDKLFADATAQSTRGRWEGLDRLLEEHAGFEGRLEPTRFIGGPRQSGPVDENSLRERVARSLCNLNARGAG